MNSLAIETVEPRAQAITINEDSLSVDLMDGRTIIAPLIWYPRLLIPIKTSACLINFPASQSL